MNKVKAILYTLFLGIFFLACSEDDATVGELTAPSNLQVTYEIIGQDADNPYGDGSGNVKFSISADNAITYKLVPSSGPEELAASGEATLYFGDQGTNEYTVVAIAYGAGGLSTSETIILEVYSEYQAPPDLIKKLVGTSGSKTWRIKSEKQGHFGLGPVGGTTPTEWYGAGPNEKAGTGMYDDRYVFHADGTFDHITNNTNDDNGTDPSGTVFGRVGLISEIGSGGTVDGSDVQNLPYQDVSGTWRIIKPGTADVISLSDLGFIGYYTGGNHQYEIFDWSVPNELLLRTTDGNNEFDWWFIITSDDQTLTIPDYTNLIWSDEFDGTALDATNWTYDIGTGNGGWGNGEEQFYTDRADNLVVSDGSLKITAKKEPYQSSSYTSARIKSQGLFDFKYGRVEIKAKLAGGGGSWPALWMLGSSFSTVGWPDCGEIDIMEYVGNNPNTVFSSLHYPGNSAGNAITQSTSVSNAESEFHVYECIWSDDVIQFRVDGLDYHTFTNNVGLPFNDNFFLIMNVAMGGNFGGTIDPGFTTSTMEVDYVKVYQ